MAGPPLVAPDDPGGTERVTWRVNASVFFDCGTESHQEERMVRSMQGPTLSPHGNAQADDNNA